MCCSPYQTSVSSARTGSAAGRHRASLVTQATPSRFASAPLVTQATPSRFALVPWSHKRRHRANICAGIHQTSEAIAFAIALMVGVCFSRLVTKHYRTFIYSCGNILADCVVCDVESFGQFVIFRVLCACQGRWLVWTGGWYPAWLEFAV
jgi:hypothetical protein